jgi:hypothetical protein
LPFANLTGDPEVNLYQSLQFVGGVSVAALRRSEVDRLFDEPVAMLNSQPARLDLEHTDGRTREIRTTREYRDAIAQGFIPTCHATAKFTTLFDLPLGQCSPPWSGLNPRGSASSASPGPASLI